MHLFRVERRTPHSKDMGLGPFILVDDQVGLGRRGIGRTNVRGRYIYIIVTADQMSMFVFGVLDPSRTAGTLYYSATTLLNKA